MVGRTIILISVAAIISLSSCGNKAVFREWQMLDSADWIYGNRVQFEFAVTDTTTPLDINLLLEHGSDYPFENLYFTFEISGAGTQVFVDTLNLNLTGPKGHWLGNCRGDHCTLGTLVLGPHRFQSAGSYRISFGQYTRRDTLTGIRRVGLEIRDNRIN